jgi:hypothetical protein
MNVDVYLLFLQRLLAPLSFLDRQQLPLVSLPQLLWQQQLL